MSKIPTAEEFLNKYDYPSIRFCNVCMNFEKDLQKMLIEFAKLHVEACKKEINEKVILTDEVCEVLQNHWFEEYIDKNSILNAYPLENIK